MALLFYDAVVAFAGVEGLRVAVPNADFTPATGEDHYLQANPLPVQPGTPFICSGASQRSWVCQVDVVSRAGMGDIYSKEYADKIASEFPYNHKFIGADHTFTVVKAPYAAPALSFDGWFSIPVSFKLTTVR